MDANAIETTLAAADRELAAGRLPELRALGFWRAVAAVKRDRRLVARYADRIAHIDRATFVRAVPLHTSAAVGIVLLFLGFALGILLLGVAEPFDRPWRELVLLAAAGALDATTHGLAHFLVGTAVGIRYTDAFVDLPKKPQPGLKIDYASYLRASATGRAWMHASGAIATKLTPFVVIPYALAIRCDAWAIVVLLAIGVLQIATDVLFSVKASDWKKFRREMRLARRSTAWVDDR
ncbi:MAG TPA: hypothetical protein VFC31_03390 [Candidatus Limnocylindria bacterium]|nr:hypothetical protein [Candidatus Limnocylindria bacterium]